MFSRVALASAGLLTVFNIKTAIQLAVFFLAVACFSELCK
jgi:hypothetical protein